MSKLGCRCGAIIRDQTDDLPYKGEILKDQDRNAFLDGMLDEIVGYIAAVRNGTTEAWYASRPGLSVRPDSWLIDDILSAGLVKFGVEVFECPECGRLWVQKGVESLEFVSFVREEPGERVLPSEHYRAPAG